MRKSQYGKETIFLWEGSLDRIKKTEDIKLITTDSSLIVSEEWQKKIDKAWKETLAKNPHAFDGKKWRTEFVYDKGKELQVFLSPTVYSQHNILRHVQDKPIGFYPNPFTINTVQETADGYILIGVKGKTSDQKGLGLMGAGFLERYETPEGESKKPENLGYVVQKECMEETKYNKKLSFTMEDARALAVVFGSNHDTTVGFHLPIFAAHKEVALGNEEHNDLIFLPNADKDIADVLNNGGYKGIPAADHMLGCLESYLNCKKIGMIESNYQHK